MSKESKFDKPTIVDDISITFGGKMKELLPPYEDIPKEFRDMNSDTPAHKFQQNWFFRGLNPEDIPPARDGIDHNIAMRHLAAIQRSWEPKHEHKVAAVAFLADKWLDFQKLKANAPKIEEEKA